MLHRPDTRYQYMYMIQSRTTTLSLGMWQRSTTTQGCHMRICLVCHTVYLEVWKGNGCVTLFHLDNYGEKSAWHECTRPNQSVHPHTWSSLLCALKPLQHYSDIEHKFPDISPSHRCYHHHNHNHSDNHYGEYSGTRFHFHIFNRQQIFWVTSCL